MSLSIHGPTQGILPAHLLGPLAVSKGSNSQLAALAMAGALFTALSKAAQRSLDGIHQDRDHAAQQLQILRRAIQRSLSQKVNTRKGPTVTTSRGADFVSLPSSTARPHASIHRPSKDSFVQGQLMPTGDLSHALEEFFVMFNAALPDTASAA